MVQFVNVRWLSEPDEPDRECQRPDQEQFEADSIPTGASGLLIVRRVRDRFSGGAGP
jgi:hypothetical protein